SLTLYYDKDPPSLSETAVNSADTVYTKANLLLGGTVADTNGLASLMVSLDGGTTSASVGDLDIDGLDNSLGTPDDGGAWSYPLDIDTDGAGADTGLVDGSYSIVFVARDAAGKTTTLARSVRVDTTAPTVSVAAVSGYVSGTIPISGTAADAYLSGVEYQLGGTGGTWESANGTGTWTGTLDMTSAAEGAVVLYVRSIDRAGNVSSNATTTINIDRAAPRATETAYSSTIVQTKTSIIFSGIADDAGITSGRSAASAVLTWTKDGGMGTAVPLTPDPSTGAWSWTLSVNAATHENDGLYSMELLVTDVAGKTARVTRSAQVDTTEPTLVVSAPVNGESTSASFYAMSGTARDTGGVGFDGTADVEYDLDLLGWQSLALSGTSWSKSDLNLGAVEGAHTLSFRSTDKIGNVAEIGPITLYYDVAVPVFTETLVGSSDPQYSNSNITFSGAIADSNGLGSLTLGLDGGAPTSAGFTVDLNGPNDVLGNPDDGGPWSFVVDIDTDGSGTGDTSGLGEGSHNLVFVATDAAGKTTTIERTVVVDTIAPTVSISPVVGYVSGTIPISGNASDTNLNQVEYQLGGTAGAWTSASGAGTWIGSLGLTAANEGPVTLYVRSLDRAGNVSVNATTTVNVDRANPRATETSYTSTLIQTNASLVFAGIADDAAVTSGRTAASATLTWSKDGGAGTEATLAPDAFGAWTWTLGVNVATHENDGLYLITILVTDDAGKTASVTRSAQVDTSPPTLVVNAPVDGESTSGSVYAISGTSRDTGGVGFDGVADVEFKLDAGGWGSLSLIGVNWAKGDLNLGMTEGSHVLNFRSTDKKGNQATVGPITLYYDVTPPTLSETNVGTADPQYRKANLSVGGSVGDTNGLSSMTVSADGGSAVGTGIMVDIDGLDDQAGTPDDGGTWTYAVDVDTDGAGADTGLAEGSHTLVFVVTDAAGKTASVTRTVVVDTIAPTATVSPVGGYVSGVIPISGTALDTNLSVVEYQLGGTGGAWTSASGTGSWTGSLDLSSAAEGAMTLYVRSTDRAGNFSSNATTVVNVDRANPRATETTYTSTLIQSNAAITFAGFADDAAVTALRAAATAILTWTKDGGAGTDVALSPDAGTGAWSWALSVNAATHENDGLYLVTVLVTDAAGKTASVTRSAQVDTTAPTLTVSAPVSGESTL
ncbi:MAG: Ig-like domain repeat protein, partial [Spirochaetaceae bacterium]|nr:Ig-like domain repeat protein [Spirochaetaceae bacterium]